MNTPSKLIYRQREDKCWHLVCLICPDNFPKQMPLSDLLVDIKKGIIGETEMYRSVDLPVEAQLEDNCVVVPVILPTYFETVCQNKSP